MKKLLITGGLGNLGSWLTDYFAQQSDYEVYVLTSRQRSILTEAKFQLITCDISSAEQVENVLSSQQFDAVIHTASVNDYFKPNFVQDALLVNALGTRNLLEHFSGYSETKPHFIYFSTFQIYGRRSGLITEDILPEPKNDYGSTHLFAEYYVKQFHANQQLPYTTFRLTNSYGCPKDYDSSKWYLVLNDLARMAATEEKIVLKSNGKATRDFIWMGDVCRIVDQVLKLPQAPNDTFNICGEQTFSMLDVAQEVQTAYQKEYGKQLSIITNEQDTTQYPDDLRVSAEKLKSVVNYSLTQRFQEEATTIFYMLKNKP
ncbi:MAG: NAD-dependent epimerase/dehydratase family protein [Cyclobacteriaceae bacterium]